MLARSLAVFGLSLIAVAGLSSTSGMTPALIAPEPAAMGSADAELAQCFNDVESATYWHEVNREQVINLLAAWERERARYVALRSRADLRLVRDQIKNRHILAAEPQE